MPDGGLIHHVGAALHATGVARPLQWWLLRDVVTVVLYHGVIDAPLPVPDACFLPFDRFVRQMEYLKRHFSLLHLEEAFDPQRPPSPRPVACVTFDDGFANLHDLALPVLERLRIPATVYLVTDLVDTDESIWYTRLHSAIGSTGAAEILYRDLRLPLRSAADRRAASAKLQEMLKSLARPEFTHAYAEVLDRLGNVRPAPLPPPSSRILRRSEIRRMSRDDLVRFGSHTATHQILTRTDPADVRCEIGRSVAAVAAMVDRPSRTFAYPNGGPDDFDDGTIGALREVGVEFATTTIEGPNPRDVDPYRIRRYFVNSLQPDASFMHKMLHARALLEALSSKLRGARRPEAGAHR